MKPPRVFHLFALNALVMQGYLHEYGWKHTDFAQFHQCPPMRSITRMHACTKPSLKPIIKSRMVAEPINLLDASPIGDGAAALVIVACEEQNRHDDRLVSMLARLCNHTLALRPPRAAGSLLQKSSRKHEQAGIQLEDGFLNCMMLRSYLHLSSLRHAERAAPRLAIEGAIRRAENPHNDPGWIEGAKHPARRRCLPDRQLFSNYAGGWPTRWMVPDRIFFRTLEVEPPITHILKRVIQ
jgi:acetyl-CoA C-acetyltransferase